MGQKESVIDPEIRALTQLVSSFIQKKSSLNYQTNQLRLAQNTKKTCIETKKLRDIKAKNATLVIEIQNTEKILEKIKQKKFIKYIDKDLSSYASNYATFVHKKSKSLLEATADHSKAKEYLDSQKQYFTERNEYCQHLQQKHSNYCNQLTKNQKIAEKIAEVCSEIEKTKSKLAEARIRNQELSNKHLTLAQKRKLKRRATLVVPKLSTNAYMLRSELLRKVELVKQINELKADQKVRIEQQDFLRKSLKTLENEEDEESEDEAVKTLHRLNTDKDTVQSKIEKYKSELEAYQTPQMRPFSPITPVREVQDSLDTEYDMTSESVLNTFESNQDDRSF